MASSFPFSLEGKKQRFRFNNQPFFVISPTKTIPFLNFSRDHLRSTLGITYGRGSFAVHFGDHLRSRDHLWLGIICGTVQFKQLLDRLTITPECCRVIGILRYFYFLRSIVFNFNSLDHFGASYLFSSRTSMAITNKKVTTYANVLRASSSEGTRNEVLRTSAFGRLISKISTGREQTIPWIILEHLIFFPQGPQWL